MFAKPKPPKPAPPPKRSVARTVIATLANPYVGASAAATTAVIRTA